MNQINFRWSGNIPGRGEALPSGHFVCYCPGVPEELQTQDGPVELPQGQPALFLRIANDGNRFACQGHADDQAWEFDGGWIHRGRTCGTNAVIYDANDVLVVAHQCAPPTGSQGWSHVAPNGALIPTDACYDDPSRHLHNFTDFGDVAIGQGGDEIGEGSVVRFADDGILRRLTFQDLSPAGMHRDIRVRRDGDLFAITVVDYGERLTTMTWAHLIELRQMQPVSAITPIPPDTEPPMAWPNLLPTIEQVRAKYPAQINAEQSVAIVNEVCWIHRAEGFGLLAKPSGNKGHQTATGVLCSVDWFCQKTSGLGQDGMGSTPNSEEGTLGPAVPQWGPGEPFDVTRWVAPVAPVGGDNPDPGDEDPDKHPYTRDDDERDECNFIMPDGRQCDQPKAAEIHQVSGPFDPPPVDPPPAGSVTNEQLMAEIRKTNATLARIFR